MKFAAFLILLITAIIGYGAFLSAQAPLKTIKAPIVVELYTSQGCSSCPPADRILAQIAENDQVITLACHVSYFNYLSWTDTLSQEFCDMRQHGYSAMTETKRIYTPQMIVNGENAFIGSNREKVNAALNEAQKNPIMPIAVTLNPNNLITFTLPAAENANYRLWAFGYKSKHNQDIKSGENSGLSATYTNPATSYTNLGAWDGGAGEKHFEKPENAINGITIFAQENGYGRIIAAGKLDFSKN